MTVPIAEVTFRRLLKNLWWRSGAWAVACGTAAVVLAAIPFVVAIAFAVGAFYLTKDGELTQVVGAAVLVTFGGVGAEGLRRRRLWKWIVARRLSYYDDRRGDIAVQFRVDHADLQATKKALRGAGYFVDLETWRTEDGKPGLNARYRPDRPPSREPEKVLHDAGIAYVRTGNSVTIGPAYPV
jgi:hypothetical protein